MKKTFITFAIAAVFSVSLHAQVSLTQKWETAPGLQTPESVIYDTERNVLYVANINGKSGDKDGNGFISKLKTDGKIETLEWVKGLDAPKGLGIFKNKLYVADLNRLVIIDINNGQIEKAIEIKDAQFLNDITVDSKGKVYISDSAGKKVFIYENGEAVVWFENSNLQRPNGLLWEKGSVKLIDAQAGVFFDIKTGDKAVNTVAKDFPAGGDGIVGIGKNEYLISNWNGEVYHLKNDLKTKLIDTKEQKVNAADIWYIESLKLVLVPTFYDNKVVAYQLSN